MKQQAVQIVFHAPAACIFPLRMGLSPGCACQHSRNSTPYNIMIIMLSKYICHCNTECSVFQGFFLIFLYLVILQGIRMPSLFCLQEDFFFLNIVCRKSPGKPVHIAAGGPLACLLFCPIFWQSAIKSMAHNNHYVVKTVCWLRTVFYFPKKCTKSVGTNTDILQSYQQHTGSGIRPCPSTAPGTSSIRLSCSLCSFPVVLI